MRANTGNVYRRKTTQTIVKRANTGPKRTYTKKWTAPKRKYNYKPRYYGRKWSRNYGFGRYTRKGTLVLDSNANTVRRSTTRILKPQTTLDLNKALADTTVLIRAASQYRPSTNNPVQPAPTMVIDIHSKRRREGEDTQSL